ncbi:MAG: hypothetical protein ACJ76Y_25775 [Thermoanaerobaculia bacterium]
MKEDLGTDLDVPSQGTLTRARSRWIGLASFAVACAVPLVSFALLFPLVDNVPKWDQWSLIEVWEAHYDGRPVLPLLLQPYNGHLNLLPRFLFYGLGLATHWNLRTEVLLSFLFATGTAATLLLMLRDSGEDLLLMAAPITAVVFSFGQFENFLSGYPMGQVLSQLACTLAVFSLTRPRITARHVAFGAAVAAIATFSWGAGLAAWPMGLAALTARPENRRRNLIFWCTLTLAGALIVKKGAGAGGQVSLQSLMEFDTAFFLALIGRPLTYRAFPEFSAAVGCGLLVLLAFVLTLDWALRSRRWLLALRWGLLGATALAAAGLVTLARAKAGPGQALASHYSTATYPLFLSVLVLGADALLTWRSRATSRLQRAGAALLVTVLVSLPIALVLAQSRETLAILRGWVQISQTHDQRLLAGTITDDEIRGSLHPDPALVRHGVIVLREHRLAAWADSPAERHGD